MIEKELLKNRSSFCTKSGLMIQTKQKEKKMQKNIITCTDSYKLGHWNQYPEDTEIVYSYWEARKGAQYPATTFVGLQYLLKEYLEGVVVTEEKIQKAKALSAAHFGTDAIFNEEGWRHILNCWGGLLPIEILSVAEGQEVPIDNVMMTIQNTDKACAWLTNHLETILCQLWYPCTVATLSKSVKRTMAKYLEETADTMDALPFMLHDFGFRGASSVESAGIGGAGHLVNFLGTDTVKALEVVMDYYGDPCPGFSVPATEHSVMTSRGPQGEEDVVAQLLRAYPTGILSIVADSYDVYNFTENIIGGRFRDLILARDGTVVIRPDSGDYYEVVPKLLASLGHNFGKTRNSKGYYVINPKVKLLWGDGLSEKDIENILEQIADLGWSVENIVFGMGGGLLQKINRDTQRFAFKCSAQRRSGEWVEIYKDPLDYSKKSKRGRLSLQMEDGIYTTVPKPEYPNSDILQTVFLNGNIARTQTFEEIRQIAAL